MATAIKHNPVTKMLADTIEQGIADINSANETLLTEETGTKVSEIDKAFKADDAEKNIPAPAFAAWKVAQEAYEAYRKSVDEARNIYRVEVLKEEPKSSVSEDEKELKETTAAKRKVVMDSITLLVGLAKGNGMNDVAAWAESLSVPQVGRKGTSTVGQKKPRVFVKVDDGTVYDSFTLAAAAISTKDKKFTASDLSEAWNENGGAEGEFKYADHVFAVTFKPKKSA